MGLALRVGAWRRVNDDTRDRLTLLLTPVILHEVLKIKESVGQSGTSIRAAGYQRYKGFICGSPEPAK